MIVLTAPQALAWAHTLEYYGKQFQGKDLLQREMAEIKNILGDIGNNQSVEESSLDARLARVLERAAPVYRAIWRSGHDRSNHSRIWQLVPLVYQHDRWVKVRLSDTYKTKWTGARIPTDVVSFANCGRAHYILSD